MASDESASESEEAQTSLADLHHDKWLVPAGGYLAKLAEKVFIELEATTPRPAKVRRDAAHRRVEMVENAIANLALLVNYRGDNARLIVSASNARLTRYDRPMFPPQAFVSIIEGLERLGLVECQKGTYRGPRTTLRPTYGFRGQLASKGGTPFLRRLEGAESIQLRASRGRRKPKVLVDYQDAPETVLMRSQMSAINKALNAVDITLNGRSQPPVHLVRMFQMETAEASPTFDLHGRLYGGFWEYLPKRKRHLILIDGQQVAEADFASLFVQLAYAEVSEAPPVGDAYEGTDMSRDAAKIAMSALLCRQGHMRQLPPHLKEALGEGWNGPRVTATMVSRHPAISHLFGRGIGLKLMYVESCIMVSTLLKLIENDIVALPIHDGLLVPQQHRASCIDAMESASQQIVGRSLPVRLKR